MATRRHCEFRTDRGRPILLDENCGWCRGFWYCNAAVGTEVGTCLMCESLVASWTGGPG
jgi:hypothetical protein